MQLDTHFALRNGKKTVKKSQINSEFTIHNFLNVPIEDAG